VELTNDGAEAVNLDGFTIEDHGGSTALPPYRIEPGEYVVVANDAYVVDEGSDVPPAADATVLRVARLGKQGLANAGEQLQLRAPDGTVCSTFPAVAAKHPGVSIARRDPSSADGDPTAFGEHAPPGASPGAPNQLP